MGSLVSVPPSTVVVRYTGACTDKFDQVYYSGAPVASPGSGGLGSYKLVCAGASNDTIRVLYSGAPGTVVSFR